MAHVNDILERLPERHRIALTWFAENAGSEQQWPKPVQGPDGETLLASKAKGIYKPTWSTYALSVRQSLGGPYADRDPIQRSDGTWSYSYFQENEDPTARDEEYTNRGLIECWQDGIPVGVMRQVSHKPNSRYQILGLALVSTWDGGYFFLEGFSPEGHVRPRGPAGEIEQLARAHEGLALDEEKKLDLGKLLDARERAVALIVRRRGQPEFRRKLIEAYGARCAITGCEAVDALEAAHITPYLGRQTSLVENGLLLRADIHTLFDLGLVAVDPESMCILISASLESTAYAELAGRSLRTPALTTLRPNLDALRQHRQWAGL